MVQLHQIAAALYLVAGLGAVLALALPAPRLLRAAPAALLVGALFHAAAFAWLHRVEPTPPLTELPAAVSFTALVAVLFSLLLLRRARLAALCAGVGPLAFLGAFFGALGLADAGPASFHGSGSWPHAHVLLGSAGLALLGVAGLAGALYLVEHRRLKRHRPMPRRLPLPTLEALDRANRASLALGFPLLTLGVVTGLLWVQTARGQLLTGSAHETFTLVAWAVYAALASARFLSRQGSRQAAASAVGGFAFLFFAVVGLELLS